MNDRELTIASWCLALAGDVLIVDHLAGLFINAGYVSVMLALPGSTRAFAEYWEAHSTLLNWSLGFPRLWVEYALALAPVWAMAYTKFRRWRSSQRTPAVSS